MQSEALYISLTTLLTLVAIKVLEYLINRVKESRVPFLNTTPILEAAPLVKPCTVSPPEEDESPPCTGTSNSIQ